MRQKYEEGDLNFYSQHFRLTGKSNTDFVPFNFSGNLAVSQSSKKKRKRKKTALLNWNMETLPSYTFTQSHTLLKHQNVQQTVLTYTSRHKAFACNYYSKKKNKSPEPQGRVLQSWMSVVQVEASPKSAGAPGRTNMQIVTITFECPQIRKEMCKTNVFT